MFRLPYPQLEPRHGGAYTNIKRNLPPCFFEVCGALDVDRTFPYRLEGTCETPTDVQVSVLGRKLR